MKPHEKKLYLFLGIAAVLFIICVIGIMSGNYTKTSIVLGNILALLTTIGLFYATLHLQKPQSAAATEAPKTDALPAETASAPEISSKPNAEASEKMTTSASEVSSETKSEDAEQAAEQTDNKNADSDNNYKTV